MESIAFAEVVLYATGINIGVLGADSTGGGVPNIGGQGRGRRGDQMHKLIGAAVGGLEAKVGIMGIAELHPWCPALVPLSFCIEIVPADAQVQSPFGIDAPDIRGVKGPLCRPK